MTDHLDECGCYQCVAVTTKETSEKKLVRLKEIRDQLVELAADAERNQTDNNQNKDAVQRLIEESIELNNYIQGARDRLRTIEVGQPVVIEDLESADSQANRYEATISTLLLRLVDQARTIEALHIRVKKAEAREREMRRTFSQIKHFGS